MIPARPLREGLPVLLDRPRPLYRAVAATATARGLLDTPEDAFFLPLDLAGDLTQECKPSWLESGSAPTGGVRKRRKTTAPPERNHGPEKGDGPARGAEGLELDRCCRCHSVRIASGWVHALWPSVSRYGSAPETLGQGRRKRR